MQFHFDLLSMTPIVLCIFLIFIGLHQINKRIKKIRVKRERIHNFLNKLKLYVESGGRDGEAFLQMVHQSALVQRDLGRYGIAMYKPPGFLSYFNNYQLIVNHLSELQRWIQTDDVFSYLKPGLAIANSIQEGLIRYLGVIDDYEPNLIKMRRNPLVLLREGVGWLIVLPISVFSFIGLANEDVPDALSQYRIVKFFSRVLTLIGLVGSIVTLVTGWSQFIQIISKWF